MTEPRYERRTELVPVRRTVRFDPDQPAEVERVRNALRRAYDGGSLVGNPDALQVRWLPDGQACMDVVMLERAIYAPPAATAPIRPRRLSLKVIAGIVVGSCAAVFGMIVLAVWLVSRALHWLAVHAVAGVGAVAFCAAIVWLVTVCLPGILGGGDSDSGGTFIGGGSGTRFSGTFKGRIH